MKRRSLVEAELAWWRTGGQDRDERLDADPDEGDEEPAWLDEPDEVAS